MTEQRSGELHLAVYAQKLGFTSFILEVYVVDEEEERAIAERGQQRRLPSGATLFSSLVSGCAMLSPPIESVLL